MSKRSDRTLFGLLCAVLLALLVLSSCSSGSASDDDQATAGLPGVLQAGVAATTTSIDWGEIILDEDPIDFYQAELGSCLNEYSWVQDKQRINRLTEVSCELPHEKEVYLVTQYSATAEEPYPGEELMTEIATQLCYRDFEVFVGQSFELSKYDIDHSYPPRANYEVGYRDIICMVKTTDKTVGSARQSRL
ncbi:MAG: septum formation family protein [Acidimicrobiales bacterium]